MNGPGHSGAFEPRSDDHFASDLHHARGSAQALGMEPQVEHTLSVGLEIMKTAARLIGGRDLAADGAERTSKFSDVEFFTFAVRPVCGALVGRAVQSFSEITQVLFGMKAVNNLGGI